VALASVPGNSRPAAAASTATIHACAAPAGQLRSIAGGKSCLSGETALSWPSRAIKPTYYEVSAAPVTVQPTSEAQDTAVCHAGDLATGGGYEIVNSADQVIGSESQPGGTPPDSWVVDVYNGDTVHPYNFFAVVDCVHVP
jgi:hypothetical protein